MLTARTARRWLLTAAGTLLVAASVTSSASAATERYASPNGSGSACTSASPCSVTQAVNAAALGDEVIVAPGDYALTTPLKTASKIVIHGVAGQPRPRLLFSGGQEGLRVTSGSTLRYVEVDQAPGVDANALFAGDATVDQVIARAAGAGSTAAIQNSTIRNSIAVASGTTGRALVTDTTGGVNTSTYRNVTAIAQGANGVAIQVAALFATGRATVNLVNVIGRGVKGLEARTDSSGAEATFNVTHTNYIGPANVGTNATIVDLGGNQTGVPSYANWPAGDFRQAPGSVTIDAGLADPANGTLDVDGDPRNLGTVDIGADELVHPPAATTGPASAITDHSAMLSGSMDGHGGPTTYRFEYGPTTTYGSTSPSIDAGLGAAAAAATVGDLNPSTTYHYRLMATNSGGVTVGADQTFTSAAAPPSPVSASAAATAAARPAFAGVRLVSTRLTFAGRFVTVKLSCPTGTVGRCAGTTKLTARRPKTSTVTVGRARFSIAAGQQVEVEVRVSRAGRRLLSRVRRLPGKDTNAARDAAGQTKTTVAAVRIRHRGR
jgi:hypothetical protein